MLKAYSSLEATTLLLSNLAMSAGRPATVYSDGSHGVQFVNDR
jgi:hypothetical protein